MSRQKSKERQLELQVHQLELENKQLQIELKQKEETYCENAIGYLQEYTRDAGKQGQNAEDVAKDIKEIIDISGLYVIDTYLQTRNPSQKSISEEQAQEENIPQDEQVIVKPKNENQEEKMN